jgi:hypothetical protein
MCEKDIVVHFIRSLATLSLAVRRLSTANVLAGSYKEAYDTALKTGSGMTGPSGRLQNRLLFHLAHKLNDENKLMIYHQKLTDDTEDQVTTHSFVSQYPTHLYQDSLTNSLTDSFFLFPPSLSPHPLKPFFFSPDHLFSLDSHRSDLRV